MSGTQLVRWAGLILGPILGVLAYVLLPSGEYDASGTLVSGLSVPARGTAGVATLMAVWWLTEAIPLYATALLPIALLPLVGAASISQASSPYGSHLIFLFMGGFILGLGMEKWGLHRRIALITISLVGTGPVRIIAGFMIASALMSMFVSNTATAVMMLPIGISVAGLVRDRLGDGDDAGRFATCLMLGIAYACSIGGVGTLIGTPPNLVLANFVSEEYGVEITMFDWFKIGLPVVGIFLPIAWLVLTRVAYPIRIKKIPGGRELIHGELRALGTLKRGEWIVFIVFATTAFLWVSRPLLFEIAAFGVRLQALTASGHLDGVWTILNAMFFATRPFLHLSDPGIAMLGALALFVIPVKPAERIFAMDWETARRLPWGILLLFGGGLSLANAMTQTGLDAFLGEQFTRLEGVPTIVIICVIALGVIFLTEMTSNTAVTNTLMPVLAGASIGLGVLPQVLLVPAAIAASCAFMLPVATPPNAIVFSSGQVTINQMIKTGFWLNLIGVMIVTLLCYFLVPVLAPNHLDGSVP